MWVKAAASQSAVTRSTLDSGDSSKILYPDTAAAADQIQALETDGFQVGTNATVNTNLTTYYWWAMKYNVDSSFDSLQYTGNSVDSRTLTGLGMDMTGTNVYAIIRTNTAARAASHRPDALTGDATNLWQNIAAQVDYIQAFTSDGVQVGAASDVNLNTVVFDLVAWKAEAALTVPEMMAASQGGAQPAMIPVGVTSY